MTYKPSRRLEVLAETLIPPACREQALGDLAECSGSGREYLANLASILPGMIRSQIRCRVSPWAFAFNVTVSALAFIATQGYPRGPFFAGHMPWLRLAVPLAVWLVGLVLADAYGPADKAPPHANGRLFAATLAGTLIAAALAGVPVGGVGIAMLLVIVLSLALLVPFLVKKRVPPPPLSMETLPQQAQAFQRGIWWRNLVESLAAFVVVTSNVREIWNPASRLEWASHSLLALGVCFVVYVLHFHAGSRRVPENVGQAVLLGFHRREIARQRDMLRAVPLWYLLPFVPGMLVGFADKWQSGSPGRTVLGAVAVAAIFAGVWRLNVWAANHLDRQLRDADQLERQLQ